MLDRILVEAARSGARAPAWAAAELAREFPTVSIATDRDDALGLDVAIDVAAWRRADFDFWSFDRSLDEAAARSFAIGISGGDEHDRWTTALEVLTRAQRLVRRRNRLSESPTFDRLIERHRALCNLDKPLVRADYDHAIDVWQWTLRLAEDATLEVQAAALLHDVERLVSEADARVEHLAHDYRAFKDAHAVAGAELARELLVAVGFHASERARIVELIARHEHASDDPQATVLNDADALSFFSLNSAGFLDYFGIEHAARKVAYSLGRLTPRARERLARVRLRPEIARLLRACRAEVAP